MPSCKPRTLSPGNSFVPNAAFLRAAGENSTRATGLPGGPGQSRQGSAGPASGRRVGRWLRGPAKKRPRAQPAERGAGARGARAAGRPEPRGRGRGPVAVRPVFLSPRPHSALLPAPSPRHLRPYLSLASRPAVRASAGAFPPPGSRHLTCGCSPRPPAQPRARQPSRPRGHQDGGGLLVALFECRRPVMPASSPECVRSPQWVTGAGQACHVLASKSRLTKPAFMSKAWPSGFLDAPGSSGRQRPAARSHFPRLLRVTAAGRRLTVGSVAQAARPLPRLPGDLPPSGLCSEATTPSRAAVTRQGSGITRGSRSPAEKSTQMMAFLASVP